MNMMARPRPVSTDPVEQLLDREPILRGLQEGARQGRSYPTYHQDLWWNITAVDIDAARGIVSLTLKVQQSRGSDEKRGYETKWEAPMDQISSGSGPDWSVTNLATKESLRIRADITSEIRESSQGR